MTRVITYGTYDLLHRGHVRLLERARALGDYLIVGVTAEEFDKRRGKINVRQSLAERMEAVRATGLADEVIVEEYEGQKIDDIQRYDVDVFAIGSDWRGRFDYLGEWCEVVYLDRTEGISSSMIRSERGALRLGLVGDVDFLDKVRREAAYVNGVEVAGLCSEDPSALSDDLRSLPLVTRDLGELLDQVDAIYTISHPSRHYEQIRRALEAGVHVLCESPIVTDVCRYDELRRLAEERGVVLADALRTAYSTAYHRLGVLVKSGAIGRVVSVDAACTSLRDVDLADRAALGRTWNSICEWGPNAMLPVFQLLGTDFESKSITTLLLDDALSYDAFTKVEFGYPGAVASVRVGKGVKSEGELVVSGTEGYVYVPAPWWKTEYFEVRREDQAENKRYFFQLDGEGIRNELVSFSRAIDTGRPGPMDIAPDVSGAIVSVIDDFFARRETRALRA